MLNHGYLLSLSQLSFIEINESLKGKETWSREKQDLQGSIINR